jgi:UDP-N-acetylmuramoyl-tripeptide--D-alanyl-D-alanine ligase
MTTIDELYEKYLESTGVTTDTRKIGKDNIFFALKGDNFDGNRFALQAIDKGAIYAVVDDTSLAEHPQLLQVENVLTGLQALAKHHRRMLDIPVIGITGSNGKTTTKELLAAILGSHYKLHFTQGNFNNHIGVPLTLLDMPLDTDIAIIEMGANHVGEIAVLSEITEPTHGVITNIGKAHLEGFGGIEGVKRGKSELYKFLAKNKGVAFVNLDEPFLLDLAKDVAIKVKYQQSENPDLKVTILETELIQSEPRIKIGFLSDKRDFKIEADSHLIGYYNFQNIQTAVTIGRYFKVPHTKIKQAIESYDPKNNRSQILKKGSNVFFLDAYNANPTSMRNALDGFASMAGDYKIAIIGDMLELGEYSESEHQSILQYAQKKGFDQIVLVGNLFNSLPESSSSGSVLRFTDVEALKSWYEGQAINNSTIFLKGSRGVRLETLIS